ncbi:MAG: hypothetical protein ACYSUX_06880 [Planctomycetota bacterium]|jgi:hypothetical protein
MTVESLMNTFTQYVSWLYSGRDWARWELLTVAVTALVLLLIILVQRRKARAKKIEAMQVERKSSSIDINLNRGKGLHQRSGSFANSRRVVSISKNNGNQMRWKETTKKWKSLQKLIEQLQQETASYKKAEESLEQQFAKLKATNEQLRQEISGSGLVIEESELSRLGTIDSPGRQNRILNPSGVLTEES